jgi:phytoene dehydrogenase-like protein
MELWVMMVFFGAHNTNVPLRFSLATICIIGGGVSGLTAAITASNAVTNRPDNFKVVLLEATPDLGGRVQSDVTDDGFVLDRGFAVFIEEYPVAKEVLDMEALNLGKFLPGALVKCKGRTQLAKVADPLRQPAEIFNAVIAPVGSIVDKIKVLPLLFHCVSKDLEELFQETEVSTMEALTKRWGFGDDMITKFYKPFLEGIYLAPLEEQSSRMFHFVFKMFSEGAATLPAGGIRAVSTQLSEKAAGAGVDLRTNTPVASVKVDEDGMFDIALAGGKKQIKAHTVILATDGQVAQKLMSTIVGLESLESLPENPQRSVGCLYYGFDSDVPIKEPILVLNGMGEERGTEDFPVNNVCFPSVVSPGYAPEGKGLCSVTVLKDTMELYKGREKDLDEAVRKQLGSWFPDHEADILETWDLKKIYYIPNAQPAQFHGPFPANINGGRASDSYRGLKLPTGLVVCGDHMATATLNGALESGVNAGRSAAKLVGSK